MALSRGAGEGDVDDDGGGAAAADARLAEAVEVGAQDPPGG